MSGTPRTIVQRLLREAEGYLELGLPNQALERLQIIESAGTYKGQKQYLTGEALRALDRYQEAVGPLLEATDSNPSNIHVWIALGWCYKRMDRLELAIRALERAQEIAPGEAIVHYNLACYWSLAGKKQRALEYLSRAIKIRPQYRDLIGDESDFDPIRSDPDFQALTSIIV